jgi:hypothetical protein
LLALFLSLAEGLERGDLPEIEIGAAEDDDGHEGELKKLLVRHRKREHRFRAKKITDVMQRNDGHPICEVPHCGFDFHARPAMTLGNMRANGMPSLDVSCV